MEEDMGDDQMRRPIRCHWLSLWDDGVREERAGRGGGLQGSGLVRTVPSQPDRERVADLGVDIAIVKTSGRMEAHRPAHVPADIGTSSIHQVLIASSHLDYTPEIRAAEFASTISTLPVTPTSVFCGDTNIDTYPELKPLLSAGYVDSWLDTHSDFADSPDLREVGVTFGTTGLRGPQMPDHGPPRRLDYVMARGIKIKKCELVGGQLIPRGEWATSPQEQELDLEVYVSDHLGVLVDVELE